MPNSSAPAARDASLASIRGLLLVLVAATLLPLTALLVWSGYNNYTQAKSQATTAALGLARVAANSVEGFLSDARRTMDTLAARPQLRRADANACDPIFGEIHDLYPQFTGLGQANLAGELICSAYAPAGGVRTVVRHTEWFRRVVKERRFVVAPPHAGLLSGKPVVVLAHPVFGADDELVGSIQLSLDMTSFKPVPGSNMLPLASVVAIVDSSGVLVARSREAERFVGRPLHGSPILDIVLSRHAGSAIARSSEGVERIYGFQPVAGTDWYAIAGINTDDVFASARRAAVSNALLALAIIAFALVVVNHLRRRITGPVQALRDTAQRVAGGDLDARAPSGGPAELAEVAARFNAMLDANAQQVKALAEREADLRQLFDSSLEAILRTRPGGEILQANQAACTLFRLSEAELLKCKRGELIDENDPRLRALSEERARTGRARSELTLIRGDGTRFQGDISTISYAAADGTLRSSIFVRDLSDRIQKEELRAAKEAAELANRAKSNFLARMSHELRTPMNAILGFAQLLTHEPALAASPKALAMVAHVGDAGRHLLVLIDEVLDLSRIEAGALALSPEPIELGRLLTECLALTAGLAEQRQIRIERAPETDACWVRADRTRARQVLVNVLSNAIKYNRIGGSVTLRLSRGDERVALAVHDTGHGLTGAQLAALFQPFNRLGAEGSAMEGTGLGLVIVQQLLKAMSGSIEVSSQPGVGSIFTLRFPRAEAPPAPAPNAAAAPPFHAAGAAPPRRHVLYIEDNPANVALVREVLVLRPHTEIETAADGPAGLAAARRRRPDLILLDINLPGIDGFEVLRRLQAEPALAAVPCVAISANAMPGEAERALAAGFVDYVIKPFDVAELLARLTLWLT